MKPVVDVGIAGYGSYVPMYRIKTAEISRVWGRNEYAPIDEKSLTALDEDSITIACEAAKYALRRAQIDPQKLGAVYVGSESPPYAVKPSGTVVAAAIGASPYIMAANYEFACKAGTETFQACIGLAGSKMVDYALGIGVDTSQGRPQDELEYTVGCGGAAFIFGQKTKDTVAYLEGSLSYTTDTPDFWRREHQMYPRHGGRFTGDPAYFRTVVSAGKALMNQLGLGPSDFAYVIAHQPNQRFPVDACKSLGFPPEKVKQGLLSPFIGNTYAGSSPMGLASVLDVAKPGERILLVSYGSGAGSDAFSFVVQDAILAKRDLAPKTDVLVNRKCYVDYAVYLRQRGEIKI